MKQARKFGCREAVHLALVFFGGIAGVALWAKYWRPGLASLVGFVPGAIAAYGAGLLMRLMLARVAGSRLEEK